jgi:hypothetical protein
MRTVRTKVTLTVDREVLPRAKRYARRRGISLSKLVEDDLKRLTAISEGFSSRWRGKLKLAPKTDPRFSRLAEKHSREC